ncbi:MAG: hypothetical protein AAF667_11270 [Pseudomonadota bacterium]
MPHDAPPAPGHNHTAVDHLHSHPHQDESAGDIQVLASEFIEGFMGAKDKSAYLELAGIPREIADTQGGPPLKLVDVALTTEWQVGTASPSFGSSELSYLPFPGSMVRERANMGFVYVSLGRKVVVDLRTQLADRKNPA